MTTLLKKSNQESIPNRIIILERGYRLTSCVNNTLHAHYYLQKRSDDCWYTYASPANAPTQSLCSGIRLTDEEAATIMLFFKLKLERDVYNAPPIIASYELY